MPRRTTHSQNASHFFKSRNKLFDFANVLQGEIADAFLLSVVFNLRFAAVYQPIGFLGGRGFRRQRHGTCECEREGNESEAFHRCTFDFCAARQLAQYEEADHVQE
jgi:hypothetical protein